MKRLLILTDESVLAGHYTCGIAEVADSIAASVTDLFTVAVYCPRGDDRFTRLTGETPQAVLPGVERVTIFGVEYWMDRDFPQNAAAVMRAVGPDILHCFTCPEILDELAPRPERCVYTVEDLSYAAEHREAISRFDALTTVSKAHAETVKREVGLDTAGIVNGILTPAYAPEKGLMLPASYTAEDQEGKELCKASFARPYSLSLDKPVFLLMGRLVPEKGVDAAIDALPAIREGGGMLLVVGRGDGDIEGRLSRLGRPDGVIWVKRWVTPVQVVGYLAGADFLLNPSVREPCGLTAMKAARYGTVPVTTLAGGLRENMDEEIAVVIRGAVSELGTALKEAVERALELYRDKEALRKKRAAGMGRDFSWTTRRAGYLELYGALETRAVSATRLEQDQRTRASGFYANYGPGPSL